MTRFPSADHFTAWCNFSIDVNNDQSAWLKITGNRGVKDFIASELQL